MNSLLNQIHVGDAISRMKKWPAGFVDLTVTSPPYWMQRSYLPEGHPFKVFEMGQEAGPDKYLADQAELFSEVYRITKPGGTLFVNVGDKVVGREIKGLVPGYADGELLGLPWKLSEAIRGVGWRRVSEIIWDKPNPMTGARTNGPLCSHEHVFMFTKGDGFFDPLAISDVVVEKRRKPRIDQDPFITHTRQARSVWRIPVYSFNGRKLLADIKEDGKYLEVDAACLVHGDNPTVSPGILFGAGPDVKCTCTEIDLTHFAAMPPALAERCILAATSDVGNCSTCGTPYRRLVEKARESTRPGHNPAIDESGKSNRDPGRHVTNARTVGWERRCKCPTLDPYQKPVVFDPYCGSGVVPAVAQALGRDWLATELSPAFARKLAPARIAEGYERTFRAG